MMQFLIGIIVIVFIVMRSRCAEEKLFNDADNFVLPKQECSADDTAGVTSITVDSVADFDSIVKLIGENPGKKIKVH